MSLTHWLLVRQRVQHRCLGGVSAHLYAAETTSFRTLAASRGPSPSAACRSARFDSSSCSERPDVWVSEVAY